MIVAPYYVIKIKIENDLVDVKPYKDTPSFNLHILIRINLRCIIP